MGAEVIGISPKIKAVYLKGYRAAIEEICQKLEMQAFKIQDQIEKLEGIESELKGELQ